MPLATLKEVLGIATQSKTAIPGFNIDNIEIPEAIITAAEEYHCPVILTIGQGAIQAEMCIRDRCVAYQFLTRGYPFSLFL